MSELLQARARTEKSDPAKSCILHNFFKNNLYLSKTLFFRNGGLQKAAMTIIQTVLGAKSGSRLFRNKKINA